MRNSTVTDGPRLQFVDPVLSLGNWKTLCDMHARDGTGNEKEAGWKHRRKHWPGGKEQLSPRRAGSSGGWRDSRYIPCWCPWRQARAPELPALHKTGWWTCTVGSGWMPSAGSGSVPLCKHNEKQKIGQTYLMTSIQVPVCSLVDSDVSWIFRDDTSYNCHSWVKGRVIPEFSFLNPDEIIFATLCTFSDWRENTGACILPQQLETGHPWHFWVLGLGPKPLQILDLLLVPFSVNFHVCVLYQKRRTWVHSKVVCPVCKAGTPASSIFGWCHQWTGWPYLSVLVAFHLSQSCCGEYGSKQFWLIIFLVAGNITNNGFMKKPPK